MNAPARNPTCFVLPDEFRYQLVRSQELRRKALLEILALSLALDEPTPGELHELAAALDGYPVDPDTLGPCAQHLLKLITDGPLDCAVARLLRAGVRKETIADILYPPLTHS